VPKKGAGAPKKVQVPQSQEQVRLGIQVQEAEARREVVAQTYGQTKTVASELALLQADMEVSTAWSAYLRATNNHTHSLKWADQVQKLASRVAALRELAATDLLVELAGRSRRENEIARRVGGGR
jgi:hypothetical protein